MHTIIVERREQLKGKLLENNIESSPVHYRNDKYSIFAKYSDGNYPNMDSVEDKYLCLPIHTKMNKDDVVRVCNIINDDW
jgi:dTDP-4-amino-4,6-dideoxygalactose transaminase